MTLKGPISIYDAKAQFSRICEDVATYGTEVTISRHGKPIARIVPFAEPKGIVFGIAKGQFEVPDDFDAPDPEVLRMFGVEE